MQQATSLQDSLFDQQESRRRQNVGIEKVSAKNAKWLAWARAEAAICAHKYGRVSSDDIHERCPLPETAHPNVMGSVFRTDAFEQIGWEASKRPSAHARTIRVYRLKRTEP